MIPPRRDPLVLDIPDYPEGGKIVFTSRRKAGAAPVAPRRWWSKAFDLVRAHPFGTGLCCGAFVASVVARVLQ